MNAIDEAAQAGFDLSLVDHSLDCTYEQRAIQHQAALSLALELAKIGQQLRGGTEPASSTSVRR